MNNDRFTADLRQHLLATANERPAEGQLAAVIDAVATTRQRLPLLARLTWKPGRVGPLPSTAIRYGLVAAALALAMVAGALFAGSAAERRPITPFEGSWTTIDPADTSGMTFVVGPGIEPEVYFEDGYASGEACVADEVKRFTARGEGEIKGNTLDVTFPDGGGCGLTTVPMAGVFEYDEASDSLIDQDGLQWTRPLGERPPAMPASPTATSPVIAESDAPSGPTPDATAAAPSPAAKCFDIPAGEAYVQAVGELSLKVTVPASAAFAWQGYRDGFELAGACLFGRPVLITATMMDLVFGSCGHAFGRPPSTTTAIEWLTTTEDYTTSDPTEVTIAGRPAARLEISFDSSPCNEAFDVWTGVPAGAPMIVYVVDIDDGVPLGIAITNPGNEGSADQVAEAEVIMASLEIVQ